MPYYKVYFRYVDKSDKVRRSHVRIGASSIEEAKGIVLKEEKKIHGTPVAVDKVVKQ